MEINRFIESLFLKLGAIRATVNVEGIATHWKTQREAKLAEDKIVEIVTTTYFKMPKKHEVFQNPNGTWAMFAEWPTP